ncbi:hypothetical protein Tco_0514275 [Tanacetum coccineum]
MLPQPITQQPEFPNRHQSVWFQCSRKGDDPIEAINHMMSFLTADVTSGILLPTFQLMTSSNPRQQATIYDGNVTMQPVHGRQNTYAAGTTRKYTSGASGSNTGKQRIVICYNCKGQSSPSMHLTSRRSGSHMTVNCDELNSTKNCSRWANLSGMGSDALTEVHNPDNLNYDLFNQSEQIMTSSEQSNDVSQSETEITTDSNIIPYSQFSNEKNHSTLSLRARGLKHTKACFRDEIIPFIKELKDIFNNFNQYLVEELADVQKVFYQMEQAVEQHRLESRTFKVKMNQVLSENERLLAQAIDKDIVKTVVNYGQECKLMEISIADQIALDDALVAPTDRLKIGKCNLRLSSDVTLKEATLQVAYDVLKLTPFYKAFQVSADVPEIYMQEF